MLSISPAKSPTDAQDYYERDNYYIKADAGDIQSVWFGDGAMRLGLAGEVNGETFVALLEGKLPTGQQLGISKHGEYQHRPGYDLTFSAPKSVSIIAEIGGDKRLVEAHTLAVNTALAEIEQHATARRSVSGVMTYEPTKNLVIATFKHGTSRALDPQLHTHAVVLNVTQRHDGKFVSLASQSKSSVKREGRRGFMEQVYSRQLHFGMVYRAALAQAIVKLGYQIRHTHGDGRFEIEGISKEAIHAFSKRREDIEAALEARGLQGAKASEQAALKTRERKRDVDKAELLQDWKERAEALGLSLDTIVAVSKAQQLNLKVKSSEEIEALAKEAVDYGRKHLAERQSAFLQDELEKVALSHALGVLAPVNVRLAIEAAIKEGSLIVGRHQDETYLTTPEAKAQELHNIELMQQAKDKVQPISHFHQSSPTLWSHGLNKEQFEAANLIVTTEDGVVGVQGYAGTGKTTLLKAVNELVDMLGYEVRGMAPSAAAALELAKGSGIPSQTLDSFLVEMQKIVESLKETSHINNSSEPWNTATPTAKQLWVLDESSLTSSRALHELLLLREATGAHLVLLGDIQQLHAVESGKPFEQLQKAGMITVIVNKIVRQKNLDLMQAVYAIIDHDVSKALNKVGDFIQEFESKTERLGTIASDYLALSQAERKETLVVAQTNDDRQSINQTIREGLRKEGSLQGPSIQTEVLVNKGLTLVEQTRAKSYEVDNLIKFNKDIGPFKKGEYYRVAERYLQENQLLLESRDKAGKKLVTTVFSPIQQGGGTRGVISVFEKETRSLAKGDAIRWTLNQRSLKRINATTGVVQSIDPKRARVLDDNGHIHTLKLGDKRDQHYDYGYVWTVYAAQGKTVNRVLAHDESFQEFLTNQKGFYVIISRAKYEARLYIDNQERYASKLEASLGDKVAALELSPLFSNRPPVSRTVTHSTIKVEPNPINSSVVNKDKHQVAVDNYQPAATNLSGNQKTQANHTKVERQSAPYYDKALLYQRLVDMAPYVVERLLGEPTRLGNSTTWRYGRKGSLAVSVKGDRAGFWHNFETGENGNLFQLIAHTTCLSFPDVLTMAAELTGTLPQEKAMPGINYKKTPMPDRDTPSIQDQKSIAYAASIIKKSKPIHGTIAERYLEEHRGITLAKLPESLRFIPSMKHSKTGQYYPALLSIATNHKGEAQAVQITYLDSKTHNKADIPVNKIQHGRMRFGAQVLLQQGKNPHQEVIVAEGVETALSLAQARPDATVLATLSVSNMRHVTLSEKVGHIIIGADNDKGKEYAMMLLEKGISHLQTQTQRLSLAIPDKEQTDFNDVLKQAGAAAVKELLERKESITLEQPEKGHKMEEVLVHTKIQSPDNVSPNMLILPPSESEQHLHLKNPQFIEKHSEKHLAKAPSVPVKDFDMEL